MVLAKTRFVKKVIWVIMLSFRALGQRLYSTWFSHIHSGSEHILFSRLTEAMWTMQHRLMTKRQKVGIVRVLASGRFSSPYRTGALARCVGPSGPQPRDAIVQVPDSLPKSWRR